MMIDMDVQHLEVPPQLTPQQLANIEMKRVTAQERLQNNRRNLRICKELNAKYSTKCSPPCSQLHIIWLKTIL